MVGGLRSPDVMAKIIREKQADFVSMCRPLIREPMIIKKWQDGNKKPVSCVNCNKCFIVVAHNEMLLVTTGHSNDSAQLSWSERDSVFTFPCEALL